MPKYFDSKLMAVSLIYSLLNHQAGFWSLVNISKFKLHGGWKMKKSTFIRVLLLVAILLPAGRAQAQGTLTNGLVAFYPLNGNANDASGNGFNANHVSATPCPDRFGNPNQAFYFDGVANYIGFPTVPLTEFTSWTLAAWIQPASLNRRPM